jgi:predicted Zn-dependent peptidase
MDNIDLAIKFVCNVSENDLTKVNQKEFETERDVVYNEAKKAWDNHQLMFHRNVTNTLLGYHKEDNIIGVPQTIKTFTLQVTNFPLYFSLDAVKPLEKYPLST